MMFNKVLMVLDANISWESYKELAQKTLINFLPSQDILQGRGPMDVLDHSCNRLGVGGKICFDLTAKAHRNQSPALSIEISSLSARIKALGDGVVDIDSSLLAEFIPVLLIFVEKTVPGYIANLRAKVAEHLAGVKIVLFFDANAPKDDYSLLMWIAFNNIEPVRDTYIDQERDCLFCDATVKTKELDGFQRDWPNPVVSDMATIEKVDALWPSLGLGDFIVSPSRKIQSFMRGEGASIYENS